MKRKTERVIERATYLMLAKGRDGVGVGTGWVVSGVTAAREKRRPRHATARVLVGQIEQREIKEKGGKFSVASKLRRLTIKRRRFVKNICDGICRRK